MEYSRKAKKTFLRTFELYDSDSEEEYDSNVANSFNADGTAKNGCGRRSKMITDKKKVTVRLQVRKSWPSNPKGQVEKSEGLLKRSGNLPEKF